MPPASACIATAGDRFLDADGPRHDPDGVGVWRTGKIDAPRQSSRRLGPGPPAGEEARPSKVSPKVENAIRTHLSAGKGILKVAALVGVGSGTVQRVKRRWWRRWSRRREVGAYR